MRNAIFATCSALAVAGAISVSAQTPPTPAPTTPQTTSGAQTVTVTGCLKPWDGSSMSGSATGSTTPGTTAGSTASTPAKFLLTNVMDSGAGRTGAMGSGTATPSTPGMTSSASDGNQYTLTGNTSVNLAQHLNHQVRVTGSLSAAPTMGSTMGTMGTPGAAGSTGTAGSTPSTGTTASRPGEATRPAEMGSHAGMGAANAGTITVSSVTMVNATCTGASF